MPRRNHHLSTKYIARPKHRRGFDTKLRKLRIIGLRWAGFYESDEGDFLTGHGEGVKYNSIGIGKLRCKCDKNHHRRSEVFGRMSGWI